jgi:hypothetical protein
MSLVYLSPVAWGSFAQRPHKFVEWFNRRTGRPVIWVEPYPTRLPNWRDLYRPFAVAPASDTVPVPPWLTVLNPGGFPIEPLPGSGCINRLIWARNIGEPLLEASRRGASLVIGKPSGLALELLSRIRFRSAIYDAMDDFPAFYAGLSRAALLRRERQIAQSVDTILVSSSALEARWSAVHDDVRLVNNGLDLSRIRALVPGPAGAERAVFGYVGTMASWFDWRWVCALAQARADDEIRLIGPVFDRPARRLPANVRLLPPCDHSLALRAMTQFHVGLIPFKKNRLTDSVDPIKYYEYRSIGLPVLSTSFGEMSRRVGEPGVFVAGSPREVASLAATAIGYVGEPGDSMSFAVNNAWELRFDAAQLAA